MSGEDSETALRIVEAGRRRVVMRLRAAFARQVGAHAELGEIDPAVLDRLVHEAADRAGAPLWRIALAEGAVDELGVSLGEALDHPAVSAAAQLVDAPEVAVATPDDAAFPAPVAASPPTHAIASPQALRVPAVHTGGIETLKPGDKDIELRLSDAGLDVIKRSSGEAIGRLAWGEITGVELAQAKRSLRGRRRAQSLQVRTARGQASFELPGLSDEEAAEHLRPLLQRLGGSREPGAQSD